MKFDRQSLAELKARNLPHLRASDISEPIEDTPEAKAQFEMLDKYLNAFVAVQGGACICCGAQQGAKDAIEALFGKAKFRWGFVHGEGICSECGYPARAMHYIGEGAEQIVIRNLILQYHPDGLSFDKEPQMEEAQ